MFMFKLDEIKDTVFYSFRELTDAMAMPTHAYKKWLRDGLKHDYLIGKKKYFKGRNFKEFLKRYENGI
jgi:hypothetical protein